MKLSPSEQLSLIIEYTTNESKRLVQKLRNAYVYNPAEGLEQVWKKLRERFGSNSVLVEAYLQRATKFPRIGDREKTVSRNSEIHCWSSNALKLRDGV